MYKEVNLDAKTPHNAKTDPMCKNQILPKMAKSKIHCRLYLCPCLFQIDAKDKGKVVCGANRLRPQPHLSPMIQLQPCLEPLPFSKKSFTFSLQNHPHTFPINWWRCPFHFPSLKSPQTYVESSSWTIQNRDHVFEFQSVQTPNNHP